MKKYRKVALFDMDGTLADYYGRFMSDLSTICSPEEKVYTYNDIDKHPYLKQRKLFITNQPGWWLNLPQLPLGFQILDICEKIGYEIMILTKGPWGRDNAWTEKLMWCNRYLPGRQITITMDKSLTYGRVLVDDYPEYALNWLEHRPRGLVVMPKSQACEGFSHKNVVICDNSHSSICEVTEKLILAFERE